MLRSIYVFKEMLTYIFFYVNILKSFHDSPIIKCVCRPSIWNILYLFHIFVNYKFKESIINKILKRLKISHFKSIPFIFTKRKYHLLKINPIQKVYHRIPLFTFRKKCFPPFLSRFHSRKWSIASTLLWCPSVHWSN